ncbi:MAG: SPW repeat protein [Balneolaceae bacterium]
MKLISTRIHGTFDYLFALTMIVSPWLFGFARYDSAMWVPILLGLFVIIYSFFTDYERGVIPDICVKTNLCLDGLAGVFLAVSPWLFGFANIVYVPHLIVGLAGMAAALLTVKEPAAPPRRATVE